VTQDDKNTRNTTQLSRVELVKKRTSIPSVSDDEALAALAKRHGVPATDLSRLRVELSLLDWIPQDTALQHVLLPIAFDGKKATIVMGDPSNKSAIDEFEFVTGQSVSVRVALEKDVVSLIKQAYQAQRQGEKWYSGVNYAKEASQTVDTLIGEPSPELEIDTGVAGDKLSGTALVVEDDPAIRRMLVIQLERVGLSVVQAKDGQEALDYLARSIPNIAVVDAMLPKVHGFELVKRIKDLSPDNPVGVIVLTAVHRGWRFAEDLRTIANVRHYIEKPFAVSRLIEAVYDLMVGAKDDAISSGPELAQGVSLLKVGRIDDAVSVFLTGLRKSPQSHSLHYHLGLALERQGHLFEAIAAIEQAIAIQPRYFVGVKNLAVLYHRAGFQSKSTEMWERALALAPEDKTREAIRSHLQRLL
jgi:DNA-binding response OmpR family regulator